MWWDGSYKAAGGYFRGNVVGWQLQSGWRALQGQCGGMAVTKRLEGTSGAMWWDGSYKAAGGHFRGNVVGWRPGAVATEWTIAPEGGCTSIPLSSTGLSMNSRPDGAEAHLRRYLMWHRPNGGGGGSDQKAPDRSRLHPNTPTAPCPIPQAYEAVFNCDVCITRQPAAPRSRGFFPSLWASNAPQKPQEHSATWLISARVCAACGVCATARGFVVPRARPAALGHGGAPPAGGILSRMPGAVLRSCFGVGGVLR